MNYFFCMYSINYFEDLRANYDASVIAKWRVTLKKTILYIIIYIIIYIYSSVRISILPPLSAPPPRLYFLLENFQLQLQGQWTRWENYVKNDLSWNSLLAAMPVNLLSFCLASTYDVLPSPSNLKRWRICTESSCFLCSKEICTTAHVLGACKVSLAQGRFTFRHDSVLSELASILSSFIKALPPTPPKRLIKLAFVKAGKSVPKSKVKPTGILHLASDWVIVSDLQI